jgi:hypothetical protein
MEGSGQFHPLTALPPSWPGCFEEEKTLLPPEIQTPDHLAGSLVAIPNTLTKLLLRFHFFYAQNISTPFQHTFLFYVAVSVFQ